jgi:hypothetical protein
MRLMLRSEFLGRLLMEKKDRTGLIISKIVSSSNTQTTREV